MPDMMVLVCVFLLFCYVFIVLLFFFFFSSRRRHTRCSRDWSSDVCSSDLIAELAGVAPIGLEPKRRTIVVVDRSEERRVGKSVDLGGRRIIKKKKKKKR